MKIEICANSLESAIAAQEAGADRVELCCALGLGGLTPSYGTIKETLAKLTIPVHVLIRPRSGNFRYTKNEILVMLEEIKMCKSLGCQGVVSGALCSDNTIDKATTKLLLEAANGMDFTFHRAFDWCKDPYDALKFLDSINLNRLLSSGQQTTAIKGIALLKDLKKQVVGNMEIMPGSGINAKNISTFKEAGFACAHLSATEGVRWTTEKPPISMNSPKYSNEQMRYTSSRLKIEEIVRLVRVPL